MRIAAVLFVVATLIGCDAGSRVAQCFVTADEFEVELQEFSKGPVEGLGMSVGLAMGFTMGVHDALNGTLFCSPASQLTFGDVMTGVESHWKKKLDEMDALPSQTCASAVIVEILSDRFPCEPDPKPPSAPSPE